MSSFFVDVMWEQTNNYTSNKHVHIYCFVRFILLLKDLLLMF